MKYVKVYLFSQGGVDSYECKQVSFTLTNYPFSFFFGGGGGNLNYCYYCYYHFLINYILSLYMQ